MEITRLIPAYKDYIWGGNRLKELYGKDSGYDITAESWELSVHPDGKSLIKDGPYEGKTLDSIITEDNKTEILGKNSSEFSFFPILIKLIDAKKDLSVQVHPSDEYALKNENSFGKTEMWYVIDADPGSYLVYGLNRQLTKEQLKEYSLSGEITEYLNRVRVKKGDTFFIEAGTIHAIGKGLLIAEIQQNSNLTYRLFDYGRLGSDGKPRQLHIDKAAEVANLSPIPFRKNSYPVIERRGYSKTVIAECRYFRTERYDVFSETEILIKNSFCSFTVLEGKGNANGIEFVPGDTFFVPAGKKTEIKGKASFLLTQIPD